MQANLWMVPDITLGEPLRDIDWLTLQTGFKTIWSTDAPRADTSHTSDSWPVRLGLSS